MITIKVDTKPAEKLLANIKNGLARASRDALNDTATHVRALAVKDIRAKWNVKAGELRQRIKIQPRATVNRLEAWVKADGDPIPVVVFGARQIRKGVSVAVIRGRRTLIKGGFIATMASGHRGVFLRRGRKRLPILESTAPSIPSQWKQRIAEHAKAAQGYLQRRLESRVKRLVETGK